MLNNLFQFDLMTLHEFCVKRNYFKWQSWCVIFNDKAINHLFKHRAVLFSVCLKPNYIFLYIPFKFNLNGMYKNKRTQGIGSI